MLLSNLLCMTPAEKELLQLPPCITPPEQLLSSTRADEYFDLLSATRTLASMHHGYGAKLRLQLLELLDNYF